MKSICYGVIEMFNIIIRVGNTATQFSVMKLLVSARGWRKKKQVTLALLLHLVQRNMFIEHKEGGGSRVREECAQNLERSRAQFEF